MSSEKMVWNWRTYVIEYAPDNPTYKHILLVLSLYMNSAGGSAFPSIETLSEKSSLSKPTVIKYLKEAEKDGWIIVSQHGFRGQRWRQNNYEASIPYEIQDIIKGGKGGKTDSEGGKGGGKGGKTDSEKVVKELNTNSPLNSSFNTPDNTGSKKFNFKDKLLELGADSDLIDDWLYVRKKKRAVNTERALSGFLKEVEKSGQSLNNIIEMCVVKSWRGFEADWLKEEQSLNNKFDKKCQAVRDGEIDSIKAFKNYKENKTVENAAIMWNTFALKNGFIFKETLERWDATNFQNRLQESDFDLPNILIALKDMPSDQKKYYTFDSLIKNETQYKKLFA